MNIFSRSHLYRSVWHGIFIIGYFWSNSPTSVETKSHRVLDAISVVRFARKILRYLIRSRVLMLVFVILYCRPCVCVLYVNLCIKCSFWLNRLNHFPVILLPWFMLMWIKIIFSLNKYANRKTSALCRETDLLMPSSNYILICRRINIVRAAYKIASRTPSLLSNHILHILHISCRLMPITLFMDTFRTWLFLSMNAFQNKYER